MSCGGRESYQAVIGLGANLGQPLATMRRAADEIARIHRVIVDRRSRVYRTPPAGGPPQPDYLNAALLVTVGLAPEELMSELLAVERFLGRVRPDPVRWGPRTIDLDVLWLSTGALEAPSLTAPHPRLTARPFALQPLLDVLPDARDPHTGTPYADLPAAREAIELAGDL